MQDRGSIRLFDFGRCTVWFHLPAMNLNPRKFNSNWEFVQFFLHAMCKQIPGEGTRRERSMHVVIRRSRRRFYADSRTWESQEPATRKFALGLHDSVCTLSSGPVSSMWLLGLCSFCCWTCPKALIALLYAAALEIRFEHVQNLRHD